MEIGMENDERAVDNGGARRVSRLVRHRDRAAGYIEYGVLAAVAMIVSAGVITFGQQLIRLFEEDWQKSHTVSYEEWKHRPVWERFVEMFGWILQRQQ